MKKGKGAVGKGRKLFALFCVLVGILNSRNLFAFNIYQVGNSVIAKEHNELLHRWIPRSFSVWVGVDQKKTEYLIFKADTGLKEAVVSVRYTKATRDKLGRMLTKALEWTEVARKNEADTSKGLGCFGDDPSGLCAKDGNALDENQMGLSFFAASRGQQTDLIIDIIDRENQFIKVTIYFELLQMRQLLDVARGIESALKEAKQATSKQELFK